MTLPYNLADNQYVCLIESINELGIDRQDRTGTGTRSEFGHMLQFDIRNHGFPLVGIKTTHYKSVVEELLWFISGSTNVKDLQAKGVTIWDEWADPETGDLHEVYGKQWSRYEDTRIVTDEMLVDMRMAGYADRYDLVCKTPSGDNVIRREVDQVTKVIEGIRNDPYGRRHIINAWNVGTVDESALPPCHVLYQFYANPEEGTLELIWYQRSVDVFLGLPFNIASAATLLYMVAQQTGLKPVNLTAMLGDTHIYSNHEEQVKEVLERAEPLLAYPISEAVRYRVDLELSPKDSIKDYTWEDFKIVNYQPRGVIKAPVAV